MNLRLNANAIIKNEEGKILIIKLKKGPFGGRICLPGGGVEPGELSGDTIKREIMEETGIVVKGEVKPFGFCEILNSLNQAHRVVLLLEGTGEGSPKESEEGVGKWVDVEYAEKEGIKFSQEAIRIWKNGENHFIIRE